MSITGDLLEDVGDTVEVVLLGTIARYKVAKDAGEFEFELGKDMDLFLEGVVFEVLCALHNHADKGLMLKVLERIRD